MRGHYGNGIGTKAGHHGGDVSRHIGVNDGSTTRCTKKYAYNQINVASTAAAPIATTTRIQACASRALLTGVLTSANVIIKTNGPPMRTIGRNTPLDPNPCGSQNLL